MYVIKQPKEITLAVDVLNRLSDKPQTAKQISEQLGTSHDFIQKVVHQLGRAGVVRVVRGPGGGFTLNQTDGETLTLGDIYRALGRIDETENEPGPGEMTSAWLLNFMCNTPVILPKKTDSATKEGPTANA